MNFFKKIIGNKGHDLNNMDFGIISIILAELVCLF